MTGHPEDALRVAAQNLSDFAWSCVKTDGPASSGYLQSLVDRLRAALSTPPQAKQEASTEDARDAARYRWLRSVKSTGEWGRLGHYADSALDASIDLAMTKDRP